MAYKVIILYQLYMPSYFLGTFTEYPRLRFCKKNIRLSVDPDIYTFLFLLIPFNTLPE